MAESEARTPPYIKLKAKASFTTGGNSIIFILQLLPVGWPRGASRSPTSTPYRRAKLLVAGQLSAVYIHI
ncbi:MAG: hypothetical protein EOP34_06625 [Rickettsiales bacterium]|nr:MAG: hypothetical protein EOP34_06625 [Rickettsiales bacterium]